MAWLGVSRLTDSSQHSPWAAAVSVVGGGLLVGAIPALIIMYVIQKPPPNISEVTPPIIQTRQPTPLPIKITPKPDAPAKPEVPPNVVPSSPQHATSPPVNVAISIDHPQVVDTAHLEGDGRTVSLFGIRGYPGVWAERLKSYVAGAGDRVTCQPQTATGQAPASDSFICLLPNGMDVALLALANGAAETTDDALPAYRDQEDSARAAHLGVWANLQGPPVVINNPTMRDSATVIGNGETYPLFGIQGVGGDHARELLGYIVQKGNSLSCQKHGQDNSYVCILPDGTDVAMAALLNGAARVSGDAPDNYREQQGEALANRRGIWSDPQSDMVVASAGMQQVAPSQPAFAPGDQGGGVAYMAGQPTAVIGGETVFLVYAGVAGWGYWDGYHRWHRAPQQYAQHLNQYHPGGRGLAGFVRPNVVASPGAFTRPMGAIARPAVPRASVARSCTGKHC
jgi:endonuclease YncB( thermonuclease family)